MLLVREVVRDGKGLSGEVGRAAVEAGAGARFGGKGD